MESIEECLHNVRGGLYRGREAEQPTATEADLGRVGAKEAERFVTVE